MIDLSFAADEGMVEEEEEEDGRDARESERKEMMVKAYAYLNEENVKKTAIDDVLEEEVGE